METPSSPGPEQARELTLLLYFDVGNWMPSEEELEAMLQADVLVYEVDAVPDGEEEF